MFNIKVVGKNRVRELKIIIKNKQMFLQGVMDNKRSLNF